MDSTHWLIFFGILTLATWMARGLAAVFETHQEMRRHKTARQLRYLTSGFTIAGVLSTVAMLALMVST
jgi:hypothetical protein